MPNLEREREKPRDRGYHEFSLPFGRPWGGGIYSEGFGVENYIKITFNAIQGWFLLPWFWNP